jgi:hypothetical protein
MQGFQPKFPQFSAIIAQVTAHKISGIPLPFSSESD